jgi:hypothetical protein
MGTMKSEQSAPVPLTATGLATLAAATYCVSDTKTNTTNQPYDVILNVNVKCATGGTLANRQVVVFGQASLDGTTWQTGATSGTSTVNEGDLTFLGTVSVAEQNVSHIRNFSVLQAFGFVPAHVRFVIKNDIGTGTLPLVEGTLSTSEITMTYA